jgi:tetratricopeptide (TPR) repeat protein
LKSVSIFIILFVCLADAKSQNVDSAFKYFDSGRYEQAAVEFEKVLPFISKLYGTTDTSYYSFFLYYAAVSNERNHKYERAENYYLNIKSIYEQIGAQSAKGYSAAINNLAGLYFVTGKYENAATLYLQALETNKKIYGEDDPANVRLLNNITSLYHKTGNYRKAEPMYLKALAISKKSFGEKDPNTVTILNNLGTLYDDMGNYDKAESIYRKVLEIRKVNPGIEHPDYANSANNLAQLYFKMGNYTNAEPLYRQALLIIKKNYGEEHLSYATELNNLGSLYFSMGNYEKAEPLYLEALRIRENILGKKHPDYSTSLSNLALFYDETGNYEKAEPLYAEASAIRLETLGPEHPGYAVALNNQALFYSASDNYDKAEILFLQSLSIRKNSLGEDHPDYAVSLNNLALFYSNKGEYRKAEPLFLQALEINKKVLGEMHPNYAGLLNNLAELYDSMGDYKKAEAMYLEALETLGKISGVNHPDYASILSNLALLYQETGNFDKSESMYQRAMQVYLSQIKQQFGFLSEREKELYLAKIQFFFTTYRNFILQQYKTNPALAGKAYDMELCFKGLLLNTDKLLRNYILNSGDSAAVRIYDSWIAARASLARQYAMSPGQQSPDLSATEVRANDMEKKLTRIYAEKNDPVVLQNTHWHDVQKRLQSDEAAIEFADIQFFNGSRWTDSIMYVAILLKSKDINPAIIPLFEVKQLDSLLERGRSSEISFINDLYWWAEAGNQAGYGKGQRLYNLIWKPLEKYLNGIQTVYFSPTGRLHQLSFAAIPVAEKELISDRFHLVQLSSTAQLNNNQSDTPVKKIVLFGGIEYDAGLDKMESVADKYRQSAEIRPQAVSRSLSNGNRRSGSFVYLDGTLTEVEKIIKLADVKGIKCEEISGDDAVEESVKNLYGKSSPEVIHIATHGFFFPDAPKNYGNKGMMASGERSAMGFRSSDLPLMRSGLAFAGANHVWQGEDASPDVDDGILTAYEVSNMYLPNTELVVLSACETGLGEIKGSEGVFGLQRAFKMAGSDYILMSLWQIPDYQTSELMVHFYTEWFSGKSIGKSLRLAQDFMKNKYPLQPYMWAAFVLVR